MSSEMKKIQAIKGMKDILPDEARIWQFIESKARLVFSRFAFKEIRVPVCEKTELFSRSIGDTTDIVEKEMFTFKDRNDESMTLRPEGTASVVRACIENNLLMPGQLQKLYYIGPMFRYEKPQKGRQRQFHQLGAEALGVDDPMIDIELISMCDFFLKEVGALEFSIFINSLGCPKCRPDFRSALISYLKGLKGALCKNCMERREKNPLRIFDCKEEFCKAAMEKAPIIIDYLCSDCKINFESVKNGLTKMEIQFSVNPRMVRGLDYYSKTVFEFTSGELGSQNSVLGGGRYNALVEELGGAPTPATGFALGIERLVLMLKDKWINCQSSEIDVFIASLGDKAKETSLLLTKSLRQEGLRVEAEYSTKSLKSQLGKADKMRALFVIIVGDNEIAKNSFIIRDMTTKEQIESSREEIPALIKSLIREKTDHE